MFSRFAKRLMENLVMLVHRNGVSSDVYRKCKKTQANGKSSLSKYRTPMLMVVKMHSTFAPKCISSPQGRGGGLSEELAITQTLR